jgi:hypothetical protein
VDYEGKSVYLDTANELKTLIEGELWFEVIENAKNRSKDGVSSPGDYKIIANNNTSTLRVFYESTDREEGIENLNYLSKMIAKRYEKRLEHLNDHYEHEMMTAKRQLEFSIDEEKFITSRLRDIQKRLDKYTKEFGLLNDSSESHRKSQDMLLNYSSIIEKVAELKHKHSKVRLQIDFFNKKITDLKKEKPSKRAIIVAQPPTANQYPIRPNKMRYIMLALTASLVMMLSISFFLEYISRKKRA